MSAAWAEGCSWTHGQVVWASHPNFTTLGQNLYYTTGSTINVTKAIGAWFKEKANLDYDTMECSSVCGHYTQVRGNMYPALFGSLSMVP